MKKIAFFAITFFFALGLSAKQPTVKELQQKISANEKEIKALKDSLNAIPDSTCVIVGDSTVCLPIKETQVLVDSVVTYVKENTKDGWPKGVMGWVVFIIGIIVGPLATWKVAGSKIYAQLKPLLGSRLGLAILSAAVLSALVTALAGQFKVFDWGVFTKLWPWFALLASGLYEYLKRKNAVQA
jgi:hypothetical protein